MKIRSLTRTDFRLVPAAGVEPAPCRQDRILSLTSYCAICGITRQSEALHTTEKVNKYKGLWHFVPFKFDGYLTKWIFLILHKSDTLGGPLEVHFDHHIRH